MFALTTSVNNELVSRAANLDRRNVAHILVGDSPRADIVVEVNFSGGGIDVLDTGLAFLHKSLGGLDVVDVPEGHRHGLAAGLNGRGGGDIESRSGQETGRVMHGD